MNVSNLYGEDKEYILNVYNRLDLEIVKGEGAYLFDINGERYLDMFSGIAVNALGHNNEAIKEAIIKQINTYIHLSNYFASPSVVNLAKLLVENSFASKVFFSNSGTEANEAALKAAKKYGNSINVNKNEFITFKNSFHGRTLGGLSLTGQDKYKKMFEPILPGITHIEINHINELQNQVSDKTCAIFLEMIQGEGGVIELTQDYMNEVLRLSKVHDFLIVVDEIQTGLCRTGDLFAYERFNFTPDIVTIAKSLGGGLPLGAMLVSDKLENIFQKGEHGSTFGGNPLAAAVGVEILQTITTERFKQTIKDKGNYLIAQLKILQNKYPTVIKEIRGRGFIIGIETGVYATRIKDEAFKKNLLLNITSSTVVRLLPPLNISKNEIDEFLVHFDNILKQLN